MNEQFQYKSKITWPWNLWFTSTSLHFISLLFVKPEVIIYYQTRIFHCKQWWILVSSWSAVRWSRKNIVFWCNGVYVTKFHRWRNVLKTARLAQSVEHETLNLGVVGSSPTLGVPSSVLFLLSCFSDIWQNPPSKDSGFQRSLEWNIIGWAQFHFVLPLLVVSGIEQNLSFNQRRLHSSVG